MYTIQANPSGTRSCHHREIRPLPPSHRQQRYCGRNRARQVETEHPLPHRLARGRQQRPARPLYRRYLSQQHEGLRPTTAHQALSYLAFQHRSGRRRGIMITVDTCGITAYSPLIPAIRAMCTASPGETIEIIMNHADAFQDLKEYLSEQGIGFREIYDGEQMTLQFTINGKF